MEIAKSGRQIFNKEYQLYHGQSSPPLQHDKSIEITKTLQEQNLIQNNFHFFEIGAAGARNLWYIWKENNNIKLSCNDFWEKESKENISIIDSYQEILTGF